MNLISNVCTVPQSLPLLIVPWQSERVPVCCQDLQYSYPCLRQQPDTEKECVSKIQVQQQHSNTPGCKSDGLLDRCLLMLPVNVLMRQIIAYKMHLWPLLSISPSFWFSSLRISNFALTTFVLLSYPPLQHPSNLHSALSPSVLSSLTRHLVLYCVIWVLPADFHTQAKLLHTDV